MNDPSAAARKLVFALLIVGYGSALVSAIGATVIAPSVWPLPVAVGLVVALFAAYIASLDEEPRREQWPAIVRIAAELFVLGILMAWGLAYNHLGTACVTGGCSDWLPYRRFAQPEVLGLVGLHLLTVLAYAVSRRRPEALHGFAELLVHAFLVVGILLHALVTVHFGAQILIAVIPVMLPAVAPILTSGLYIAELCARLLRRGPEAAPVLMVLPYRSLSSARSPHAKSASRLAAQITRALALSSVIVGLVAVLQKVVIGWDPLQVFTRTCGQTFSRIPVPAVPEDCWGH